MRLPPHHTYTYTHTQIYVLNKERSFAVCSLQKEPCWERRGSYGLSWRWGWG
uniref:Uncharacterized protein n=1 Tax=Anopheles quadriannulatus TaxID=34691 RepID=A0A182XR17_ANOQN